MDVKRLLLFTLAIELVHVTSTCPSRCKCQRSKVYCSQITSAEIETISKHIPVTTKRLYLLDNDIEEFPIEKFQRLKQLEFLNLNTNKIKHLPRNVSRFLPNMKELHLPVNEIENLTLLGYENIRLMKLDRNAIKNILPFTFTKLPNLKELSLQQNKIERINEFAFYGLNHLRKIDLRNNHIHTIHERAFYHTPNLEEILLDSNNLTEIPKKMFSRNKKLRILYLSNNKIQSIGEGAFANLTVDLIYLSTNKMEQLPDATFQTITVNHKIYMDNNNYKCNCDLIIRLKTYLKNLYNNNKLTLGTCHKHGKSQEISDLRLDEFNCSVCNINPCEGDSLCSVKNKTTFGYECIKKILTSVNSTEAFPDTLMVKEDQTENTIILSVSVSICVGIILVVFGFLLWIYYQRKRRCKFNVSDNGISYEKVGLHKNKRSSIYLTMVTPTKTYDNSVPYSP